MQTTDVQPSAHVAEIEIRGALTSSTVQHVLNGLVSAGSSGARALLVTVCSEGGTAGIGWALHDALRGVSSAGVRVVVFVEVAGSAAVDVALSGDVVVVSPDGGFLVHAALREPGLSTESNRAGRALVARETLNRIAPRVATPLDTLSCWFSTTEKGRNGRGWMLTPEIAIKNGWADMQGNKKAAAAVAAQLAKGEEIETPRARMLAGRLERSAFRCPKAIYSSNLAIGGV